jgi:transcription elongation factor Elf1
MGKEKYTCAHCGSDHVKKSKTKITAVGTIQHQMQCLDCGGYYTINDLVFEGYKISKSK